MIVVVDIVDGSDGGGGNINAGCRALMEEGFREAINVDIDDASDGQDNDRPG